MPRANSIFQSGTAISLTLLVGAALAAGTLAGCGSQQTEARCSRHDQCSSCSYCNQGQCLVGDASAPFDVSGVVASQWFTFAEGLCENDEHCGPWVCDSGRCSSPYDAGRAIPPTNEFAYWDGSCAVESDCGTWSCRNSWCTNPEFANHSDLHTPPLGNGDGRECTRDIHCGGDADCVTPGRCHAGLARYPMTLSDIPVTHHFTFNDNSCTLDTHCGPWACHEGFCVAPETIGRLLPARSNFAYYDMSCGSDEQCGAWSCVERWCHDPEWAYVYSPSPEGIGYATTDGYINPFGH